MLLFPLPEETDPKNFAKIDVKEHTDCFLLEVLWFQVPTYKSLMPFEFIFIHGVRKKSSLILLHIAVLFPNTIY